MRQAQSGGYNFSRKTYRIQDKAGRAGVLTLKTGQRIIDNSMPVKVISDELANENQMKSPKTIHQWFARRPLVSSRAFACAALVDWPDDEAQAKKVQDMLKMISKENPGSCDEAKKYIRKAYGGRMPRVLESIRWGWNNTTGMHSTWLRSLFE